MNLDQLRIWANDLRLSSGSSDQVNIQFFNYFRKYFLLIADAQVNVYCYQHNILINEIKQEDENVDENVTNEFSTDMV